MLNQFKPPVFSTVPMKQPGARWTRTHFLLAHLAIVALLLLIVLIGGFLTGFTKYESDGFASGITTAFFSLGLMTVVGIPILIFMYYASACRSRDIGINPSSAALMFVPILGAFFDIYLLFCPGQKGPNEYGPDPRSSS